jgi:hypothetical protein
VTVSSGIGSSSQESFRTMLNDNICAIKYYILKALLLLCLITVTASSSSSSSSSLRCNGSLYTDLGAVHGYNKHAEDTFSFAGFSRFSLFVQAGVNNSGKVDGSIDIMSLYGLLAGSYNESSSVIMLNRNTVPLKIQLRTLFLSLYFPFADLRIGRQIVNFGKGKILSPLDVFSAIDLSDISFRRSGTDLVSLSLPLGLLSGIDFLGQIPVNKHTTLALKGFTNINDIDFSAVTMYRTSTDEVLAGLGFKGDLIAGFYGEAVVHYYPRKETGNTAVNFMFGTDYSFNKSVIISLEYLCNSPSKVYNDNSVISTEQMFMPFTRGQYIFTDINYKVNDLHTVGAYFLCNIQDKSQLGTFIYTYNIMQNANLTLYIQGINGDLYGSGAHTGTAATFHYGTALEMKF